MGHIVSITHADQMWILFQGESRHNSLADDINRERTAYTNTSKHGHMRGVGGELAVARHYSTTVDTELYTEGDAGVDHRLADADGNVMKIATKTITGDWRLQKATKPLVADIVIYARWSDFSRDIELLDYIPTDELIGNEIPREDAIAQMICELEERDLLRDSGFHRTIGAEDVRAWLENRLDSLSELGRPITENMSVSPHGHVNYMVDASDCYNLPEPSVWSGVDDTHA